MTDNSGSTACRIQQETLKGKLGCSPRTVLLCRYLIGSKLCRHRDTHDGHEQEAVGAGHAVHALGAQYMGRCASHLPAVHLFGGPLGHRQARVALVFAKVPHGTDAGPHGEQGAEIGPRPQPGVALGGAPLLAVSQWWQRICRSRQEELLSFHSPAFRYSASQALHQASGQGLSGEGAS